MDDYSRRTLYQGYTPQAVNMPNATQLGALGAQAAAAKQTALIANGAQAARDNAVAFEQAAIERNNYTVDQMRQAQVIEAQNFANTTMAKRLSYADGAPGALYDANGNFNEDEYNGIKEQIRAKLSGVDQGYIGDKAKYEARSTGNVTLQKIFGQMDATCAGQMATRARRATMRNAEAALATGDTAAAAAIIQGAPDWAMGDAEKTIELSKISQKAFTDAADTAVQANDTTALARLLTDENATRGIDPSTLARYARALNNMGQYMGDPNADINSPDGEPVDPNGYTLQGGGKKGTPQKALRRLLPNGTPDYIYNFVANMDAAGADFTDPANVEAARKLIPQLVAHAYNKPGNAEQQANVLAICEKLGNGNAEYAKKLMADKDADYYGGKFNADNWLATRPREQYWSEEFMKGTEDDPAKLAWWKDNRKKKESEFRARVLGEYNEWHEARSRGENKPTYKECELQMYNIWDKHQQQYIKGTTQRVRANGELDRIRQEYAAQDTAAKAAQKKNAEEYAAAVKNANDTRNAEDILTAKETQANTVTAQNMSKHTCNIGTQSTARLPESVEKEIIYVPQGSSMAGQNIHIAVGNRSRMAEVREADIATPAISTRLQIGLGLFNKGSACEIVFNGKGRAIINESDIAPRKQMIQFIYQAEARTDKNGNLISYNSAEGKEYAGLNEQYDPHEVAHIQAMKKRGASESEIQEYVHAALMRKTQPAADMLAKTGADSPAVEYCLRDIYFNQGDGGLNKVLTAALGTPKNLGNFITIYGEEAVVNMIMDAAEARHNRIADTSERHAKYKAGWQNRDRATRRQALGMIGGQKDYLLPEAGDYSAANYLFPEEDAPLPSELTINE